jgi:glutamate 5-kinase
MRTLVVKLGSSSVTRGTGPDPVLLTSALDAALNARDSGWNVVIVSSGAVSSGTAYLSRIADEAPSRRLAAAVGQPFLMDIYRSVSEISGSQVCQLLVSEGDLRSPGQMETVAAVIAECARRGIVAIVNGNDALDPLGSDNDAVAVGIAVACGADKLLLLTDVPGVFDGDPATAPLLAELSVARLRAIPIARSGTGRGGMRSKLRAAELAALNGIETCITDARAHHVIARCVAGEPVGTRVPAEGSRQPPEARWIAGIAASHGALVINRAAEVSVRAGSSLFASGIKKVYGSFEPGRVVDIVTPSGQLIARGETRASSSLLSLVRAMQTDEIALVLTEILARFSDLTTGSPSRERPAGAQRPQVRNALAAIGNQRFEHIRRLAVEVMCLFPSATVEAMLTPHGGEEPERLRKKYRTLSSDLSFVDRAKLVSF